MLRFSDSSKTPTLIGLTACAMTLALGQLAFAQEDDVGPPVPAALDVQRIERDGISIEFQARPARPNLTGGNIMEGDFAEIEFRIASSENGEPLRGTYPGVWIDLVQTAEGQQPGTPLECRARVSNYLQGTVGMRPLIDLNSYFVMVLNEDASISVIDPVVGITGITSLYTSIALERPGADWAKTQDEQTLFVTMPRAGKVAVVDLETFKVVKNIDVGEMPMRASIQPDQKYLWVGRDTADGGVTVIDIQSREVVATIPTGKDGHHEIEFALDAPRAYVTNRNSGTVTLIDTEKLEKVADIVTGPVPISVAHSGSSQAAYVADGYTGVVTVLDQDTGEVTAEIALESGLGPMRFSFDGRWGFVTNPQQNKVFVIDAATNELSESIDIGNRPFHVSFTDTFAYIRSLDSERISMVNLQELTRGSGVVVNNFAAGRFPPGNVNDLRLADAMSQAAQDAALLVVSPADATVYYYMEGMNAPMGAFRNYGHRPHAVEIANRALKETSPGVYTSTIKVPLAGKFEIAFLNETPQILNCFTMNAVVNPSIERDHAPAAVEFLSENVPLNAGDTMLLRFRLYDPGSRKIIDDAGNVHIRFFRVPRYDLTNVPATHVGDGIYEAELNLKNAGSYYIYVGAPELNLNYKDLNYRTVIVGRARAAAANGG